MKPKRWRRTVVAAIAGFALLSVASPAFALSSDTEGANAYGNPDNGDFIVWDTKCDAHSVYGLYILDGIEDSHRINNSSGCHTQVTGNFVQDISSVKACRNVQLQPDNCGGWNEW